MNDIYQLKYKIRTIEETEKLAEGFSKVLSKGSILCLQGDLGAGKTTFSQYLCKALKVEDYITSPTFNIVNSYDGIMPIHHFDVYRISDPDEMFEIGFDDYIYGNGICIIEWANLIETLIPEKAIWLTLTISNIDERTAEISGLAETLSQIENTLLDFGVRKEA